MLTWVSGVNYKTEPGPTFMRVDAVVTVFSSANIPLVSGLGVPASVILRAHAVEVLDRFLPACPAPAGKGVPPAGSCGSIY